MKKTLCIEFDGCICSQPYDPDYVGRSDAPPVPGAMEFIVAALTRYRVVICSPMAASEGGIGAMWDYMKNSLADHYASVMREAWPDGMESIIKSAASIKASDAICRVDFAKTRPVSHMNIDPRAFLFVGQWPSDEKIEAFEAWQV